MGSKSDDKIEIKRFYDIQYLKQNPDLDAGDIPWKIEHIKKLIGRRKFSNILEIGCGSGLIVAELSRFIDIKNSIGSDLSLPILHSAKTSAPNNKYVLANGEGLPFKDSSLDLVLIVDVLEHIHDPIKMLKEVKRISKNLMLLVPLEYGHLSNVVYSIQQLLRIPTNKEQYGHIHRFNRKDIFKILEKLDLKMEDFSITLINPPVFKTLFGRVYTRLSKIIYKLSKRQHEKIFGGHTFIAYCSS
jgi:ubiquinone/menaquinone biosynthesis C-methylase UbiE